MNKIYVNRYDELWSHTVMRIRNAEEKATVNGILDKNKFTKQMVTRLNRIEKIEKVYYAISVLIERGHQDVAEIYDSRLVMDILAESL